MRLLVSGATLAVRKFYPVRPDRLGVLLGPGKSMCTSMIDGVIPYAADNGCFGGLDEPAMLAMLDALPALPGKPIFVTAPDVVGDAAQTMRNFAHWGPAIRARGLSVALVGQDGLSHQDVPWDEVDAYFVGGTTGFKLSTDSRRLVLAAKRHGKHVHMGRVNTLRRIRIAAWWGCDSIDGTGFTWFSNIRIPMALRWIDAAVRAANHSPFHHWRRHAGS